LKQLHFAQAKTQYISLQMGLRFHSRRYEQPPHRGACGITNSRWLAGDRYSSSDNDLHLRRLDSCSDGLRANAAAKRPSPTKDENQPIKPKSQRSGVQVVLMASSAEATACARGSTTPAPTTAATCPTTPHRRTAAAPKRTGRSSLPSSPQERERDRPRTRTPPSRRTTCSATPRYNRRRRKDLDAAGPRAARPTPLRWTGGHAPPQR
jgi:hypothetical protein